MAIWRRIINIGERRIIKCVNSVTQRKDSLEHYVEECNRTKSWFQKVGRNKEEKLKNIRNDKLDRNKGKCLVRLWKEKERIVKKGKQKL